MNDFDRCNRAVFAGLALLRRDAIAHHPIKRPMCMWLKNYLNMTMVVCTPQMELSSFHRRPT